MGTGSQYYYQKEVDASIARRKKQRRMARIAQLEALDDQKRSSCAFCHAQGWKAGWKFHGAWQDGVLLEEKPGPWILVCRDCYDAKYGEGRNESEMFRAMKNAPSTRLMYHLAVNKDAVFVMNYISAVDLSAL